MTEQEQRRRRGIGNMIAPPRFLFFLAIMAAVTWGALYQFGWRHALMIGFDAGAVIFIASCIPLLAYPPRAMRVAALENDANRLMLLFVSAAVTLAILVAVASELQHGHAPAWSLALVVATLLLSWTFGNTVYTLHYAHLFYLPGKNGDCGGITFPETPEPDYWDFVYFAFCLGMTFQTSDMDITSRRIRKVVTFHCLLAFVFNLGILAFTINVLGGG